MEYPKTQNLPVYVYHLTAHVGLVHDEQVYKLKGYIFSEIVVKTNHALKTGDCLSNKCSTYGNEHVEIIPHLQKKNYLNGVASELKYYYGCQIDRLTYNFVDPSKDDFYQNCGHGHCTVFIELSASKLSEEFRKIDSSFGELSELNEYQRARYESLRKEYLACDTLEYWKKRIPSWDEELEYVGKIPHNLVY